LSRGVERGSRVSIGLEGGSDFSEISGTVSEELRRSVEELISIEKVEVSVKEDEDSMK